MGKKSRVQNAFLQEVRGDLPWEGRGRGDSLPSHRTLNILVPRGRDPSGLRKESRPLAASKTGSQQFTDSLSNMTNLID